jgi:cholest-4-en-3-one 26-monooxygenase
MGFAFDDPDQYVAGVPHDHFAQLRRERPFAWHPNLREPDKGFWLAMRHAEVVRVSRDPSRFVTRHLLLEDFINREAWPAAPALAMFADNMMTFSPEEHALVRPALTAALSPAAVERLEDRIRDVCGKIRDRVSGLSHFDFASEVALAIPVQIVLGHLLAIPNEDLSEMTRIALTINGADDPALSPRGRLGAFRAAEMLFDYGQAHVRRARTLRRGNLLATLLDSLPSPGDEQHVFRAYWFNLISGAFDTTAATIAGAALTLLQCPRQLERLRADRALVPTAVAEITRWITPVVYFRRTAAVDAEIGGQVVREGQPIILCYPSANRDEEVFTEPDLFDVGRHPNPHISFGFGPHFCAGARLGQAMVRVFLEEFVDFLPKLELAGPTIHTRSAWMNRLRVMPVARR